MPLKLPPGVFAAPGVPALDTALGGPRASAYRFDLLDNNENLIGELGGVEPTGGSVKWNANASVKSGGQISVVDVGGNIDWLNVRLRPTASVSAANVDGGDVEAPLGVYLPVAPVEDWGPTGRVWEVELLDKRHGAEVLAEPVYDPASERARA